MTTSPYFYSGSDIPPVDDPEGTLDVSEPLHNEYTDLYVWARISKPRDYYFTLFS